MGVYPQVFIPVIQKAVGFLVGGAQGEIQDQRRVDLVARACNASHLRV